ncbi:site-specific integrase [Frankia sp. Cj3]|uniref:tyrosine-type recombinase/integrase n=1 Tax=Frankia sp. Cj3 TaxID=2880976 RepID=UPI001EF5473E|nr:site-specific integrase [Frankia sp. Cj3]
MKRNRQRWYWTRDTRAQADRVAGLAEDDLDHGRDPYARYEIVRVQRGMTVREWAAVWLEAQGCEPSYRAKVRGYLDRDILPPFGDQELGAVSRIACKSWLSSLVTRPRPTTGRPLAAATVANIWGVLGQLLADAVAEGTLGIDRNPCTGIRPPRRQRRSGQRHALTPEQVAALIAAMPEGAYRMLTVALAWTGCRWSECAGLRRRPTEINPMRRTITVTEPIKTTGRRDGRYHGEPKTDAGRRTVELLPEVADLLGAYLAHGQAYAFPNGRGNAIHYEDFRQAFKRAAGRCGHPEWTVHDLRHTHATWLRHCPRVAVQERLGHEPADVTDVYTHVTAADRTQIMTALRELWRQAYGQPGASKAIAVQV